MEGDVVPAGLAEDADEVDRIALEHVVGGDIDAPALDHEIGRALQHAAARADAAEEAVEPRRVLRLALFELGADDAGQIADVLRDQEIVLHEALGRMQPRMLLVAEAARELRLQVEGEPLLRAPGDEVQVAAHRPEEIRAAQEQRIFLPRQQPRIDQRLVGADAIIVFGDPEERLQVALPALALLHVRLDQVARLADAGEARVALGELGGDELARRAGDDLVLEARLQLAEERRVAGDRPRLEQRGADRSCRRAPP